MARSSGSRFQTTSARRRRGWEQGPGGSAVLVASSSTASLLGSVAQAQLDGLTVARIRGYLKMHITTSASINDGFQCALGIGVASENQFGTGIAAVEHPIDNADWDGWMYHKWFGVNGTISTPADGNTSVQFDVDTKAMRKLPDGDAVFAAIQFVEVGTATADVFFDSRMLVLLP